MTQLCPCGRTGSFGALPLDACCGRYLAGEPAPDAESLMRSRYTAFALGRADHLHATWDAAHRPARVVLDDTVWLGLVVRDVVEAGDAAEVAFVATCRRDGTVGRLRERSRFVRRGGRWWYVDGDLDDR